MLETITPNQEAAENGIICCYGLASLKTRNLYQHSDELI